MRVAHCRLNHLQNPLGYTLRHTVFSWQVEEASGLHASASHLVVARDAALTDKVWDSGWTALNPRATELDLALTPRTRYYWQVAVRSDAGEEAASPVQWFETAKLDEPWQARWIGCDPDEPRHPVFCRVLPVDGPVQAARLYLCGLGLYEVYLNGVRIGEERLAPGCAAYDRWLPYDTLDLTGAVNAGTGRLELQVLLGNGWYAGRYGLGTEPGDPPFYGNEKMLIAELHLVMADGDELVLGSDENWRVKRSRIMASGIYDGETVDATLPDLPPQPARLCEPPAAPLVARLDPPVLVQAERSATLLHTPAGETVLDIGQNLAGVFRMRVGALPSGQEVRLQFGEVLRDGNFYRGNLRSAAAEYRWVSNGQPAVLEPHFTYYGYRYVKVEGISGLCAEAFTALALWSEVEPLGCIKTGHPLLNRLIDNVLWGMRSNFVSLPTDCPQRDERLGWTGDAQVFAPTACWLTDPYAFYRKYLYDIAQEQAVLGGLVPITVPSVGHTGDKDCSAAWGDAACGIPWVLYQFSGDSSILAEQYPSMKAWLAYIARIDGDDHGWRRHFHFGDWLALDHPAHRADTMDGATDKGFIADCYYLYSCRLTARTAALLGYADEAEGYTALAEKILAGIRQEYFSPAGRCCIDTQTAHLLTLWLGLWPQPARATAALRRSLNLVDGQLRTGFVGTPLLCPMLSQAGMDETAWDLLLNEGYPGWLHEVKLGATTVWERWNSLDDSGRISSTGMNSLNHYSYGSVLAWVWQYAAGLQMLDDHPGFGRVRIAPRPDRRIGWLDARYQSPSGLYRVCWAVKGEKFRLELDIPFDCEALVELPCAPDELYNEENSLFSAQMDGICKVGAGHYEVSYTPTRPLGRVFHLDTRLGDIQKDPAACACLTRYLPEAVAETGWECFLPLQDWLQTRNLAAPDGLEAALACIPRD